MVRGCNTISFQFRGAKCCAGGGQGHGRAGCVSWDTVGSSLALEAKDSFEVKVTSELSLLLGRKGWKCVPFRICGIAPSRGRKEHGA